MPPRRRSVPVPLDVELTRQKLADGKIVRVGISRSAQFPEGAIGRVRGIGDPSVDGDEYITVELSLGGTRDVLPFAPADLTPATRAAKPVLAAVPNISAGQRSTPSSGPHSGPEPGGTNGTRPVRQLNGALGPADRVPTPARAAAGAVHPEAAEARASAGGSQASAGRPAPSGNRDAPAPVSSGTKPSRTPKRPPGVTITIATSEAEPTAWRVEAKVGARVALRSGAVSPARVWDLVQLLENETLTKAVGSILAEQRAAASARAEALTAELAAVRAELDALPDAGRS